MTWLVAVLVGLLVFTCLVAFATPVLHDPLSRLTAWSCAGVLAMLALVTVVSGALTGGGDLFARVLVIELFVAAVLGGSPVTAAVLWVADRDGTERGHPMRDAGDVLRGGIWIGVFERAAVFAALAAGWPEGLAVVLALKGLGRYSELRPSDPSLRTTTGAGGAVAGPPTRAASGAGRGVAERFLIGSFASLLWACACAGIYLTLVD
jgi:hypothetical protein